MTLGSGLEGESASESEIRMAALASTVAALVGVVARTVKGPPSLELAAAGVLLGAGRVATTTTAAMPTQTTSPIATKSRLRLVERSFCCFLGA